MYKSENRDEAGRHAANSTIRQNEQGDLCRPGRLDGSDGSSDETVFCPWRAR